ncbi:hypothetical protein LPJ66_002960 [Kickxella alabastrina]|uniref:Uncharacterized protein n=1 Tax=Kickxella alabastrina TaxID=61397 RepID=A0ACC1INN7_9FUNG|nr:hypothetical protein LPJ66_002960 [Kickxella alabastrina]
MVRLSYTYFLSSLLVIAATTASFAAATLSGTGTITYHDYQAIALELLKYNPPSCGMPYAELDLTRITAVQTMNTSTDCGQCIKVTNSNDPSKFVYVLAVDTGGRGLDLSKPSFGKLFNIDDGIGPASWTPVDNSNCVGIWSKMGSAPFDGSQVPAPAADDAGAQAAPAAAPPVEQSVRVVVSSVPAPVAATTPAPIVSTSQAPVVQNPVQVASIATPAAVAVHTPASVSRSTVTIHMATAAAASAVVSAPVSTSPVANPEIIATAPNSSNVSNSKVAAPLQAAENSELSAEVASDTNYSSKSWQLSGVGHNAEASSSSVDFESSEEADSSEFSSSSAARIQSVLSATSILIAAGTLLSLI